MRVAPVMGSGTWRYAMAAFVGLVARRDVAPAAPAWRRAAASGYEAPADAVNPLQFGRAYQLPPFGRGNGIEALFWAPLARVPALRADAVLTALRQQGLAAWCAPVRGRRDDADLWTGADGLDAAQDVLVRVLADG